MEIIFVQCLFAFCLMFLVATAAHLIWHFLVKPFRNYPKWYQWWENENKN